MHTVAVYKNILSKEKIKHLEYRAGDTLSDVVGRSGLNADLFMYFINGEKSSIDTVLRVGDEVRICKKTGFGQIAALIVIAIVSAGASYLIARANIPDADPRRLPIFLINGQENIARRNEPMSLIVGTLLVYADLSNNPFITLDGSRNVLNTILNFGVNQNIEIQSLSVGNNPISNIENVEIENAFQGAAVTLFTNNVDDVSGTGVPINNFVGNPSPPPSPKEFEIQTSAPGTIALEAQVSLYMTERRKKGLTKANASYSVEYRRVGDPIWLNMTEGPTSLVDQRWKSLETNNFTYRINNLPPEQYEVKLELISGKNNTDTHETRLNFIRTLSFQNDTSNPVGQNRLALRIHSDSVANGKLKQINGVVSAFARDVNNADAWIKTSNAGLWALELLRGYSTIDGVLRYGGGVPDSNIDIAAFQAFATYCTVNNLNCNYQFASDSNVEDAINLVLSTAGAYLISNNGKRSVAWERPGRPISYYINQQQILSDSFQQQYVALAEADAIKAKFRNEDTNYADDTIEVQIPGGQNPPQAFETKEFLGITNIAQVSKAANLLANYQREGSFRVKFTLGAEGILPRRGEVLSINHPRIDSYGGLTAGNKLLPEYSGGIMYGDESLTELTVDQSPVEIPLLIAIYLPDGTVETNTPLSIGGNVYTMANPWSQRIQKGTLWYSVYSDERSLFKVTGVTYTDSSMTEIEIECDKEDTAFYALAGDGTNHNHNALGSFVPPTIVGQLYFDERVVLDSKGRYVESIITVRWIGANDNSYRVQYRFVIDPTDTNPFVSYETPDKSVALRVDGTLQTDNNNVTQPRPTLEISITPILRPELKFSGTYLVQGEDTITVPIGQALLPDVTGLAVDPTGSVTQWNNRDLSLSWDLVADPLVDHYRVTFTNPATSVSRAETTETNSITYTFDKNTDDHGIASRLIDVTVVAVTATGEESLNAATLSLTNPQPPVPNIIDSGAGFDFVSVHMLSTEPDVKDYIIWGSTTQGFAATGLNPGDAGGNVLYRGRNASAIVSASSTLYYRVSATDDFTEPTAPAQLNISTEFSKTVLNINASADLVNIITDIVFRPNDPATNQVSWNAATITVATGNVTPVTYNISAGLATFTGSDIYLSYEEGQTALTITVSLATALGQTKHILAVYRGGEWVDSTDGSRPIISGNNILAGTIAGTNLQASNIITLSAQIANLVVGDQHVSNLAVQKLTGQLATFDDLFSQKIRGIDLEATNIITSAAQIGAASVGTLQIAGDAVTVGTSNSITSEVLVFSGFATINYTTFLSTTLDLGPSGASVRKILANLSALEIRMDDGNQGNYTVAGARAVVRLEFNGAFSEEQSSTVYFGETIAQGSTTVSSARLFDYSRGNNPLPDIHRGIPPVAAEFSTTATGIITVNAQLKIDGVLNSSPQYRVYMTPGVTLILDGRKK